MSATSPTVARLVGVYDADGSVWGEITHWVGTRLGRSHSALCDITHSSVRERREWRSMRSALPVRFEAYHRDEQPPVVADLLDGELPAVVAATDEGLVPLLGPAELESLAREPDPPLELTRAIHQAVSGAGLAWPT